MDIKSEALKYAKETFKEDRDTVFFAMETINLILFFAKENGLLPLAKDDFFRDGQMHILDVIEQRKQKIYKKSFLVYALDCLTYGYDFGFLEELLENKFFANGFTGKDAYIVYIYYLGAMGIAKALSSTCMSEFFKSIIPDSEEEEFDAFAETWKSSEKNTNNIGKVIQFGNIQKRN